MEILDTEEIMSTYKKIVEKAESFLVIVCPFFQTDDKKIFVDDFFENIKENWFVEKILFVFRPGEIKNTYNGNKRIELDKIKNILRAKNISSFYYESKFLHAKTIISEKNAMVCTMNLTDSSANQGNPEIGVNVYNRPNSSLEDKKCYKEICLTIASIYNETAREKLKVYKCKTRNYNKIKEKYATRKKYKVEDNLIELEDVDIEQMLFDDSRLKPIENE